TAFDKIRNALDRLSGIRVPRAALPYACAAVALDDELLARPAARKRKHAADCPVHEKWKRTALMRSKQAPRRERRHRRFLSVHEWSRDAQWSYGRPAREIERRTSRGTIERRASHWA